MKQKKIRETNAVSEIIGTILFLGFSVKFFSVIIVTFTSHHEVVSSPIVKNTGYLHEDTIILKHAGGQSLKNNTKIQYRINSSIIMIKTNSTYLQDRDHNNKWDLGELIYYPFELNNTEYIETNVIDIESNTLYFTNVFQNDNFYIEIVPINTTVSPIHPYLWSSPSFVLNASEDTNLDSVDLWYRYSYNNETWNDSCNQVIGEVRVIKDVESSWESIDFRNEYTNPVIVSIYNLASKNNYEACVRTGNVSSVGCEVKIQNPGDDHVVTPGDVHLIIMEEGSYNLSDGRSIEAFSYVESETAENNNWEQTGTLQTYTHSYSTPVVLGLVMSYNDSDWSVPYFTDRNRNNSPDANALYTSKHVGEDSDTSRSPETIGYIVIEEGTGIIGDNFSYEATLGSDHARGVNNNGYSYSLSSTFSVGVATQGGTDGGNGGYAVLYGSNPISSSFSVAIQEDTIKDTGRSHITEQLSYWIFSSQGNITSDIQIQSQNWACLNESSNPDTQYPWSWTFSFPNSAGYYEFYSIGRYQEETESSPEDADAHCYYE